MALDRKGRKLHVGDLVMVPALVTGIDKHDTFVNLALETVEPMHPAKHKTQMILNAGQVELAEKLGQSNADIDVPGLQQAIEEHQSKVTED